MATRSTIAIQNDDSTVTGIYCHWDGYLSNNGQILLDHYEDEATVRALIDLGNISSLGNSTVATEAYMRDKGEQGQEAATAHNWRQFIAENGQEFDYLYVPGEGWYFEAPWGGLRGLAEALGEDEAPCGDDEDEE